MIKDNIRDYAVAAFARYYKLGCPKAGEIESRIKLRVHREMSGLAVEDIVKAQNEEIQKARPVILDVDAVRDTIAYFEKQGEPEIAAAVRAVYFRQATRKNDIEFRVRAYATSTPADISTVYRWLKASRIKFAEIRGLAIETK